MGVLKTTRDGKAVAFKIDKAAVILGSAATCQIVVPKGACPRHCQIVKLETGFVLRDLSGPVGTFVNGQKVKEHTLRERDVIQVGGERFTFSDNSGMETAQFSQTAPAASTGKTARVAAPAPPKTERQPVAKPASSPGTANIARPATSRVAVPAAPAPATRPTQRAVAPGTSSLKKATGPVPKTTRKITAKMATMQQYKKTTGGFSLPATRKGRMIAIGVAMGVAGLIGILVLWIRSQDNPEEIKKNFEAEILALDKIQDIVKKDKKAEELLTDSKAEKYARKLWNQLKKAHDVWHEAAKQELLARKDIEPFLVKYEKGKPKTPDDKERAEKLLDECNALLIRYPETSYAPKLKAIKDELMKWLGEVKVVDPLVEIPKLSSEVQAKLREHDFAGAKKLIDEFGARHKEDQNLDLHGKLEEQRAIVQRGAEAFPDKFKRDGEKLLSSNPPQKDEFKKLYEDGEKGLEGFGPQLEKLKKHHKELSEKHK